MTTKAERFWALHQGPTLLVLPNIWDPLGARLLADLGYPAVATASAALAFSLGYADGQRITLDVVVDTVRRIASSVEIPVSVDMEAGYAEAPQDVAANIRRVLHAGAVGINLEDSVTGHGRLYSIAEQCARIEAVRRMAEAEGVRLTINARTDVFVQNTGGSPEANLELAKERGRAYLDAGADCLFPILLGDLNLLQDLRAALDAPINVVARPSTAPMKDLEAAGIRRLSLGPGLLKASLTTMKRVAQNLLDYGSYDLFTKDIVSKDDIARYVSPEPMTAPTDAS